MRKRISRTLFWLTILSVASRHGSILGLGTFVLALSAVLLVFLFPFVAAFGVWLSWYRVRHGQLPGWLSRGQLPGWITGLTPRRMRRRAHRRSPRQPQPDEAPTVEMAVADPAPAAPSPAGQLAGQAAATHLP